MVSLISPMVDYSLYVSDGPRQLPPARNLGMSSRRSLLKERINEGCYRGALGENYQAPEK